MERLRLFGNAGGRSGPDRSVTSGADHRGAAQRVRRRMRRVVLGSNSLAIGSLCSALVLFASAAAHAKSPRVALVVGATNYPYLETAARRAPVQELAEAMRQKGYKVWLSLNDPGAVLNAQLARFAQAARGADVAVAIVVGHGVASSHASFFLPIDIRPRTSSDVFLRGIAMRTFALSAGRARRGLVIVLPSRPQLTAPIDGIETYPAAIATPPDHVALIVGGRENVAPGAAARFVERTAGNLLAALRQSRDHADALEKAIAAIGDARVIGTLPKRPTVSMAHPQPPRAPRRKPGQSLRARPQTQPTSRPELTEALATFKAEMARETKGRRAAERQAGAAAVAAQSQLEALKSALKQAKKQQSQTLRLSQSQRDSAAKELQALQDQFDAANARLKQAKGELARLRKLAGKATALNQQVERERQARRAAEARAKRAEQKIADFQRKLNAVATPHPKSAAGNAISADRPQSEAPPTKPAGLSEPPPASPAVDTWSSASPAPTGTPTVSLTELATAKRIDALFRPEQRLKVTTHLKKRGYLAGEPTVAFNDETRAAIKKFQRALGAAPTGFLTSLQFLKLMSP